MRSHFILNHLVNLRTKTNVQLCNILLYSLHYKISYSVWQAVLGTRTVEGGDITVHASSFGQTRAMKYTKK